MKRLILVCTGIVFIFANCCFAEPQNQAKPKHLAPSIQSTQPHQKTVVNVGARINGSITINNKTIRSDQITISLHKAGVEVGRISPRGSEGNFQYNFGDLAPGIYNLWLQIQGDRLTIRPDSRQQVSLRVNEIKTINFDCVDRSVPVTLTITGVEFSNFLRRLNGYAVFSGGANSADVVAGFMGQTSLRYPVDQINVQVPENMSEIISARCFGSQNKINQRYTVHHFFGYLYGLVTGQWNYSYGGNGQCNLEVRFQSSGESKIMFIVVTGEKIGNQAWREAAGRQDLMSGHDISGTYTLNFTIRKLNNDLTYDSVSVAGNINNTPETVLPCDSCSDWLSNSRTSALTRYVDVLSNNMQVKLREALNSPSVRDAFFREFKREFRINGQVTKLSFPGNNIEIEYLPQQ